MNAIRPLHVAVVGGGAFGECHLKTWAAMLQMSVAGVYTLEADRRAALCRQYGGCLLYTSPSPRDLSTSRMPSSA